MLEAPSLPFSLDPPFLVAVRGKERGGIRSKTNRERKKDVEEEEEEEESVFFFDPERNERTTEIEGRRRRRRMNERSDLIHVDGWINRGNIEKEKERSRKKKVLMKHLISHFE